MDFDRVLWKGDEFCEPVRHYPGDAGFDLVASESTRIPYGGFVDVPMGISIQMPEGIWAMVTGRSSTLGKKRLLITPAIIDNGYRGPVAVGVLNVGRVATTIERGERIAQMIPFSHEARGLFLERVAELGSSDRGERGMGSTG